jgi:8-oxo-dGTP diphosphatase
VKRVTAAIIVESGRLFLARRPEGDPLAGLWELPGGKIEPDETPEECLARELMEELMMACEVCELVATTTYRYEHGSFELLAYRVARMSEYRPLVHDACAWIRRDELALHPLAPADEELVAQFTEMVWTDVAKAGDADTRGSLD